MKIPRNCFFAVFVVLLLSTAASAQSMRMVASGAPDDSTGKTRTYYVAADDVMWDYVYTGVNGITGEPFQSLGFFANPTPGGPRVEKPVPTAYLKTLYREYTDDTFKTLKKRPPEWDHLGFLGPLIRAEVGDTIKVVFRNNAGHPH